MDQETILLHTATLKKFLPDHVLINEGHEILSAGAEISLFLKQDTHQNLFELISFQDAMGNPVEWSQLDQLVGQSINVVFKRDLSCRTYIIDLVKEHDAWLLNFVPKKVAIQQHQFSEKAVEDDIVSHQTNKELQSQLEITNSRFEKIIDDPIVGLLVEDEDRRIVNVNDTFCRLFLIPSPAASLIGMCCMASAQQSKSMFTDPEQFVDRVNELLMGRVAVLNDVLELADGRFFRRDYIPIFIDNNYRGHMWKYMDITESKTLENKLKEQKEFYEKILNNLPADIAVFDKDHHYVFVNLKAIGDDELRHWIIGKTDYDYCTRKNKDISIADSRRVLFVDTAKAKKQLVWEECLIDKQGNDQYSMRIFYPLYHANGDFDIMIGYGLDITERKKIEMRIAQSEMRFRGLFEKSPALISIQDIGGRLIDVNQTTLDVLGYDKKDLVGKTTHDFLGTDLGMFANIPGQEVFQPEANEDGIVKVKTKNGKDVHLLYRNHRVNINDQESIILGFAQDITANINAELELKKSEEKYKDIIEHMNLGLLEVDEQGNIIYANSCFCSMIAMTNEELIGQSIVHIYQALNPDFNIPEILAKRNAGITESYEINLKDKEGNPKWMLISGAPVRDGNGKIKGSIGIYLEITEQKFLEADLRKAKFDAEQSGIAKEMFLANMSHEIRTPLNAIIGISGLLSKTKMDEQQSLFLTTVQTAAQNLLVIINDLLDFSKIESGNLTVENISFDLKEVLLNTKQILLYKAEEKGLAIDFKFDAAIAPILIGDPFRINQVILNILGNAIKFTEKGLVTIDCRLLKEESEIQQICIEIKDTGIGISEEFVVNLFDKFAQEDETITRKYGGTGLGMSISKDLVERMGGSLTVKSQKNIGTSFGVIFNLPIGELSVSDSTAYVPISSKALKGKRILLAEDNEMNRLLASTLLAHYGLLVDEAEDGKVAIEMIQSRLYDLVLMDLQMPEMDGLMATKTIREHLALSLPIIALTANACKEEESRCYAAGMDDFVSKPFEESEFIRKVAKWIFKTQNT
jgi:PAS domain S-box-containing protein